MKHNIFNSGLSGLLFKNAPYRVMLSTILSTVAGLAQITLIPLLVMAVRSQGSNDSDSGKVGQLLHAVGIVKMQDLALAFFLMCALVLVARSISGRLMSEAVAQLVLDLKRFIYQKIVQAPIRDLEKLGFSSVMATLTTDVDKLGFGARMMPVVLNYLVVIAGVGVVLGAINIPVTLFIIVTAICGVVIYQPFSHFGGAALFRARQCVNRIIEFNRGLIYGSKELKLNAAKRAAFIDELYSVEDEYKKHQLRGGTLFMIGAQYAGMMNMLIVGLVAFVSGAYFKLPIESTLIVVMTLLYLAEPIMGIVESLSSITPARISMMAIRKTLGQLGTEETLNGEVIVKTEPIRNVQVVGVKYKFSQGNDEENNFQVGPVSIELNRGEVTFITGGNGSGKSTLGKMLSLHYLPDEGQLIINGKAVDSKNRDIFRQSFSAIYTDYYIFSKLYNISDDARLKLGMYLEELHLDKKVSINNNDELSTISLSDGQRKRIALLTSFIEDRDVYIFDEWAADQDPQFKDIFYAKILAQLKSDGKIVVVITHDDRYFHLADQLVKMENGQLMSTHRKNGELGNVDVLRAGVH